MEYKVYKLSYYLNAQHSFNYIKTNIHSHTFHICLYLHELSEKGFINYYAVDGAVNDYFNNFNGKYMNEIEPFDKLIPSIENMGSVFYEKLKTILEGLELDLIQIDVSENPLRIYSVSDRLFLNSKINY